MGTKKVNSKHLDESVPPRKLKIRCNECSISHPVQFSSTNKTILIFISLVFKASKNIYSSKVNKFPSPNLPLRRNVCFKKMQFAFKTNSISFKLQLEPGITACLPALWAAVIAPMLEWCLDVRLVRLSAELICIHLPLQ